MSFFGVGKSFLIVLYFVPLGRKTVSFALIYLISLNVEMFSSGEAAYDQQ